MWDVKELTHYSKRVGHEVVAVLCEWLGGVWVVETYNNTTIAEASWNKYVCKSHFVSLRLLAWRGEPLVFKASSKQRLCDTVHSSGCIGGKVGRQTFTANTLTITKMIVQSLFVLNVLIFLIAATDTSAVKNPDCGCKLLTFNDYRDMMWTSFAEFPGARR